MALNEDVVEVRLAGLNASIYYASEFDVSRKEIEGHILIDLFSEEPYSIAEVQTLFIDFVMKTKSYLFLISDQEEKLILESSNVERLN
ncbi:MAG TPA: hypothetical protein VK543_15070 [Puia sp.]|nr:hypothetical protein [Puia sp.]